MEAIYTRLGAHLRNLRLRAEMTQEEVGSKIGQTRSGVSLLEAGETRLQIHTVRPLAKALKVTPAELLAPLLGPS